MKYQELDYSCGPASIINALRCFGIKKTEKQILKTSNTNSANGTSEEDMIRVLTGLGFHIKKHEQSNLDKAWRWLRNRLKDGPVIISVNNWQHYVAVIGRIGERVIIFDSGGPNKENGVKIFSKKELKKFWYHRSERLYTGLALVK